MENSHKLLLGKILGEIYRIQRRSDIPCGVDEAHIFGLLHGFENVIQTELDDIGFVDESELKAVMDVLEPIWRDQDRLQNFKGFYDIERELKDVEIDRPKAMRILRYLNANDQFSDVIRKMDSNNSPAECRTFELSEWDS